MAERHHQPLTERPAWHHVAAGVWLALDAGALAILVLIQCAFQPSHGILPGPTWLVDPVAGWVVGNIIGIVACKALLRFTPAMLTGAALVAMAVLPALLVKWPALNAFMAGVAIGIVGGALYWRAHSDAPAPLF